MDAGTGGGAINVAGMEESGVVEESTWELDILICEADNSFSSETIADLSTLPGSFSSSSRDRFLPWVDIVSWLSCCLVTGGELGRLGEFV